MRNHKSDVHGPNGPIPKGAKLAMCPICGARLKDSRMLKAHLKSHDLPKVQCPKCDKWLTNKYALKSHDQSTHTRDRRFVCPECPNVVCFRWEVLRDHCMYHHLKIKPYICTTCGGQFWQKIVMGRHIATAHEGWPKDKADKEWKFLLRENPSLFKQIPIMKLIKKFLGQETEKEYLT